MAAAQFLLCDFRQVHFSDFLLFITLLVRARTLSLGRMPWLRTLRDIARQPEVVRVAAEAQPAQPAPPAAAATDANGANNFQEPDPDDDDMGLYYHHGGGEDCGGEDGDGGGYAADAGAAQSPAERSPVRGMRAVAAVQRQPSSPGEPADGDMGAARGPPDGPDLSTASLTDPADLSGCLSIDLDSS